MSVIDIHRKLGKDHLNNLKDKVCRYAEDHSFKTTAKKFGMHHSTVSGWVKAATGRATCKKARLNEINKEQANIAKMKLALNECSAMQKKSQTDIGLEADEIFIAFLRETREKDEILNWQKVQTKIDEICEAEKFQINERSERKRHHDWFYLWRKR